MRVIDQAFDDCLTALQRSRKVLPQAIYKAAEAIAACIQSGGKLLICGNGGSAAEAQHLAAELVGRFKKPGRRGLPALALTCDGAVVTAWSNDSAYKDVFARQVEALGRAGDLLIGISTSGRSANVVEAFKVARQSHLGCLALLGGDGGELLRLADIAVVAPTGDGQRIQEIQLLILHLICELVEEQLGDRGVVVAGKDVQIAKNGHDSPYPEHRPQLAFETQPTRNRPVRSAGCAN